MAVNGAELRSDWPDGYHVLLSRDCVDWKHAACEAAGRHFVAELRGRKGGWQCQCICHPDHARRTVR